MTSGGRIAGRLLLAAGAVLMLLAASVRPAQGQEAGAFARLGFGARGIGASNALVAGASGHTSPYYNPALAPFFDDQTLTASAALLSFDRELQFLQFAAPLKPHAGVVFGLVHGGVGGIDGRDASGYHTEDLDTDEYLVFATFGLRVSERVSIGLSAKFYRADFGLDDVDPVEAVGFDLGLTARPTDRLTLGLAASDLLANYSWDTSSRYDDQQGRLTDDRLPTRLRLGASYALFEGQVHLLAEYESRFSWREERFVETIVVGGRPRERTEERTLALHDADARFGVEYQPVEVLTLRAGASRLASEEGVRPSAGFTVRQDIGRLPVRASYGFAYERGVGTAMHLLSLQLLL